VLNATDEQLLIRLREGNHFKANALDTREALKHLNDGEASSSARRLHADGLAVIVRDDEKSFATLLRITDKGIAYADILIDQRRPKTFRERLARVTRSDWIALGALITSLIALLK
jgi:hypothetical protein